MKKTIFHRLAVNDRKSLQELATSVAWYFEPSRAGIYISCGVMFGHRIDNRLVSSAALFCYGSSLSSLGAVIVHPAFQGRGLGRKIVQRCLSEADYLSVPVSLVATKEGFPLYTSLGFRTVSFIHRLQLNQEKLPVKVDKSRFSPLTIEDFPAIVAFDKKIFGADRSHIYQGLFEHCHQGIAIKEPVNILRGFAMSFQMRNCIHIGPLLAKSIENAFELIQPFLISSSLPIRIDVPSGQSEFINKLREYGFEETLVSPLMIRNSDALPGERNKMFAIIDPALG